MDPVSSNTVPVSRSRIRMIYGRRSPILLGVTQIFVGFAVLVVNAVIINMYGVFGMTDVIFVETVAVSWRCSAYCVP